MAQDSLNIITTMIASHLDREQDEPFKRLLAVKVDYWRSTLISRSLDKHPQQRKFFRQTLYVPMEQTSMTTGCEIPVTLCKVARNQFSIPMPMRVGNTLFDYVGSVDGLRAFREADPGTLPYMSAGFGSLITYYEWENSQDIKVRQNKFLPFIRVDGVFDKPLEVMEWNCKYQGICDFWDQKYPITGDMLQMVVQYILQIDYGRAPGRGELNIPDTREIEPNPLAPKNKVEL